MQNLLSHYSRPRQHTSPAYFASNIPGKTNLAHWPSTHWPCRTWRLRSKTNQHISPSHISFPPPPLKRTGRLTLGTLLPSNDIYDLEALLEQDTFGDGVLDGELDPDAAGMRLGPDEARVDDADLVEAPQLLEAEGKQLAGFGLGADPGRGREQPAVAISACKQ